MTSYHAFARFYDAVHGDRAEHAAFLHELIQRHHAAARTVLELACGTGSILEQLQRHYEVTGLDLSPAMLEVAADKVPAVRLVEADMTAFSLRERFDVVLCVYDSINHLLDFAQWEAVFDRAREHLDDGGVFIFDINTERRLASITDRPPWLQWFGEDDLLIIEARDRGGGVVVWGFRVFEHKGENRYLLHSEEIGEVSFPRSRIERSLRERFRSVSAYDRQRKRPTAASERIHFVAAT